MSKDNDLNFTIAENIRKYRNLKGISHEDLEELSGIDYDTIVKIETGGLEEVLIEDIEALAEALDITVDDITDIT
ncbi:helix-turn-helix domain-containing protein [Patescibacteria group bacterium]|nr:helix-turn-helix domain-containing protein [Patescibacteria group bacterium]